jgi:hypothetical protein
MADNKLHYGDNLDLLKQHLRAEAAGTGF